MEKKPSKANIHLEKSFLKHDKAVIKNLEKWQYLQELLKEEITLKQKSKL